MFYSILTKRSNAHLKLPVLYYLTEGLSHRSDQIIQRYA